MRNQVDPDRSTYRNVNFVSGRNVIRWRLLIDVLYLPPPLLAGDLNYHIEAVFRSALREVA